MRGWPYRNDDEARSVCIIMYQYEKDVIEGGVLHILSMYPLGSSGFARRFFWLRH